MKKETLLGLMLAALLTIFANLGHAYPNYASQTENDTYFNMTEPLNLSLTWTGNASHGANFTFLSTNETGAWVNYTTTANRFANLGNDTTATRTDFIWDNDTFCGLNLTWKSYANNTAGEWNVSAERTIAVIPGVVSPRASVDNITNCDCDNASHMDCGWTGTTTGKLTLRMNLTYNDSTKMCGYYVYNVTNATVYNKTSYCEVDAYVDGAVSGWRLIINEHRPSVQVMPIDLPAAIAIGSITSILIIVTVSVLRKRAGWS